MQREAQFEAALEAPCPGLDYWLHRDERGEWLLVSWDFIEDVRDEERAKKGEGTSRRWIG